VRVVLVEDEAILRQGMVETLDWAAMGCEIVGEAADGIAGLEIILRELPDVIVTDIKMPRLTGLEMLAELRNRGLQIPAVILTSFAEFGFAQEALRLGSVDYLLKPVDEQALAQAFARIREAGGEKETAGKRIMLVDWTGLIKKARRQNSYVAKALAEIRENYANHLSIEDISARQSLSASYLSRKFKEVTGHTFGELLAACRIEAATKLLQGDCRIYEVAENVGFNDYKNFCLVFKKLMQTTPKEYIKRQQEEPVQ